MYIATFQALAKVARKSRSGLAAFALTRALSQTTMRSFRLKKERNEQ
jgi:hypothetical protein